ncbi:MAG TPA: hypothetical protein VK645_10500 [Chitinophagaceae bacterium]|nr:hypothetical protein [Chitinophagaceae bacterium]
MADFLMSDFSVRRRNQKFFKKADLQTADFVIYGFSDFVICPGISTRRNPKITTSQNQQFLISFSVSLDRAVR